MTNFQFSTHGLATALLHGGQKADPSTGSRAVPIYQTTSYVFKNTEHAQNLFGLKEPGNIYTRIGNPTVAAFEERVALLEDGSAAVATSSGMSAITLALLNLAGAGDEIIADRYLYGGTYNLFVNTLPKYGITVKFVDGTNPKAIKQAITNQTKAIFAEMITNPSLYVFDVETVGAIAHEHGIPLIIDNTFAPAITKPLTWGADIVVHSATKWIGGHGTSIGGVVVDGGRFDWGRGRFPEFTEPDESYHHLRYVDVDPTAFATKLRAQLLRDIGASLSPHNAFLMLQGLETLHLRMERHQENAKKVADFLQEHPAVDWVNYPGMPSHPSHQLARKYLNNGFGSIITFGIKGGRHAGSKVIDHVKLWSHVANVGDAKSLIIHPASTTHQQLSAEDLAKSGVSEELIRLSVGLESVDDLIQDLDQAIAKATNITVSKEIDVWHWLLHSPFDRNHGTIRRKALGVYGYKHASAAFQTDVAKLKALGYHIIRLQDDHLHVKSSALEIDSLLCYQNPLPEALYKLIMTKPLNLVWIEHPIENDPMLQQLREDGIAVITGKRLYEEVIKKQRGD
ncbi:MAG TPA: O-acetylhomoserine aminocarboxypropyltransferase/cysteine synthase family protein [Bacillota bacterium]|nr:O-acetylhomoserine aminocarboxypropyltransferase/cysteine synthase family protein [Bacillota bacterium]